MNGKRKLAAAVKDLLIEICIMTACLTAIFSFVFGITVQKGSGMSPAVCDGDIIIYLRTKELLATEPVVYESEGNLLTGRVAAGAGVVVDAGADEQLTLDGIPIVQVRGNDVYGRTYSANAEALPLTISNDGYFILNDERNDDRDSRQLGEINKDEIKGRMVTVIRRRGI